MAITQHHITAIVITITVNNVARKRHLTLTRACNIFKKCAVTNETYNTNTTSLFFFLKAYQPRLA